MIGKNMHMATVVWLAVTGIIGPGSLRAQEEAAGEKTGKGIELHLMAVALLDGAKDVVIASGEDVRGPGTLHTHGFGDPVHVTARALGITTPPIDGKPGRVLGKVTLPSAGRRFLLLLVPAKDTYLCRAVRLDDPAFKAGHVCFFNVSRAQVAGTLGSRRFVTERGAPVIVPPPRRTDLPYYQVNFYYKRGDQTRPLADTRWPHDDRSRSYVFFYQNPKTGRVTYRAVDEIIESRR